MAGIHTMLVLIGVLVIGICYRPAIDLQEAVLFFAMPLLPTFLWGLSEARRQREAANAADRLRNLTEDLWTRFVLREVTEPEAMRLSRELQNAIFLRRSTSPFVFDWIYHRLRREYEEQINVGVEEMVAQLKAVSGSD